MQGEHCQGMAVMICEQSVVVQELQDFLLDPLVLVGGVFLSVHKQKNVSGGPGAGRLGVAGLPPEEHCEAGLEEAGDDGVAAASEGLHTYGQEDGAPNIGPKAP